MNFVLFVANFLPVFFWKFQFNYQDEEIIIDSICQTNWKERIIAKCLVNKIAIYSPHTALDAIYGGINDWLLGPFVCSYIRPVERSLQKSTFEYQIQLNDCNKKSLICDQLKAEKIQVQM